MTARFEPLVRLRHTARELRELGARRTLFRVVHEVRTRADLVRRTAPSIPAASRAIGTILPIEAPEVVALAMEDRVDQGARARVLSHAEEAARGRILAFGRRLVDYGSPIDWQRDPWTGARWPRDLAWTEAIRRGPAGADVKTTWEIGRFPQAYAFLRAAAFFPERAAEFAAALSEQVEAFRADNPFPRGIHWASGQEAALRVIAWSIASAAFGERAPRLARALADELSIVGVHVEDHLDYARLAVYNNHLLTESLGLLLAGAARGDELGIRFRDLGLKHLTEQASAQIYEDGAYIQNAHNYHRVALHDYVLARRIVEGLGRPVPPEWDAALDRSLSFLVAHQNPVDGRLPNYGSNDGAQSIALSSCDFADFRPVLQTVALLVRGERLYPEGPWDEEPAWLLGAQVLDAPLRPPVRRTISFGASGYHVLRASEEHTFATFRCGTLRDRFSQIDMLHVDLWWRGVNVMVDGGSYLYNGPEAWHRHFMSATSHNTVTVDGHDQMVHHRRFKLLYWTHARIRRFADAVDHSLVVGEHDGFRRLAGRPIHRRSVLALPHGVWIVADAILGRARHHARLHWLAGDLPCVLERDGRVSLATGAGAFDLAIHGLDAQPLAVSLVRGGEDPIGGWQSRYYAEKVAVPSISVVRSTDDGPLVFFSVLGGGRPTLRREGESFVVTSSDGPAFAFDFADGAVVSPRVHSS